MNGRKRGQFERIHVDSWLETTHDYLFGVAARNPSPQSLSTDASLARRPPARDELPSRSADNTLSRLGVDSHGGQLRFMSRIRGRLVRLIERGRWQEGNALKRLGGAFQAHIAFIARNPEVPRRMLRWSIDKADGRVQRRIRRMVECYVASVSRILSRAQQDGELRATIEPRYAALVLVSMAQGLVLRMVIGVITPERALKDAEALFTLFLDWLANAQRPCVG